MTKRDKSKVSKIRLTENLRKKKHENYIKATEGMYTAKSFLVNLSKSMGQEPDSLYPENADKIFKINDLVDLRLINKRTYIYINDQRFVQCFNLLFNVEGDKFQSYDNIKTMDEASQILGSRYSSWFTRITPEEAFMAHCSNIQAFFENDLNTDILHSDIAFPLLKKLVQLGYKPAERVFMTEIIKRYNEGTWKSRKFLKSEGYLKYLNKEGKRALKKDKNFETFTDIRIPKIIDREIDRKPFDKDIKIVKRKSGELIRVFDFKLVEEGITKIKSIMKEESVHELTIHRKYLQEIFDASLLEISNLDGFPIFKPGVLECFELEGILTKLYGNVLKFFDVY